MCPCFSSHRAVWLLWAQAALVRIAWILLAQLQHCQTPTSRDPRGSLPVPVSKSQCWYKKNKAFLAYLLFLCCTIWFPKLFSAPSRFQLPVKIRGKHLMCWSWGCEKHTKLALATQRRGERAVLWKHLHLHRNWVLFNRCVVKLQVSHLSRHCSFMSWIMAPSCTFSFHICTLPPFRRTLISLGCPVISGGCSWCEGHVGPSSVSLRPEPEHTAFRSCKTSDFCLKQKKFLTRLSPCLF